MCRVIIQKTRGWGKIGDELRAGARAAPKIARRNANGIPHGGGGSFLNVCKYKGARKCLYLHVYMDREKKALWRVIGAAFSKDEGPREASLPLRNRYERWGVSGSRSGSRSGLMREILDGF